MSNLTPVVTPLNDASGIFTQTSPTAIFEKALEKGTVHSSSCFLVEISKDNSGSLDNYITNSNVIQNIVQSEVIYSRLNLLDNDVYSGVDYGNDPDSGEKYRTKVEINPENLLKPNTNYAVLLSTDLSLITVFDADASVVNVGDGKLLAEGPYKGLTSDIYTIYISETGVKGEAKYTWNRISDGHISGLFVTHGSYLEIDKGLKVKFGEGTFNSGDSYTIRVIPQDNQSEIYSWTFSTGSGNYQTPDDSNSDSIINLPVNTPDLINEAALRVVLIEPNMAESLVPIARKSSVTLQGITFLTNEYTSLYNNYTIAFIGGGTAGSEVVTDNAGVVEIQIEDLVTTAQQVIDAFNSALIGQSITASTTAPTNNITVQEATKFSYGVDQNKIVVTFNKDIDETTLDGNIKIGTQVIYPASLTTNLPYTYVVNGNQLIITLQES